MIMISLSSVRAKISCIQTGGRIRSGYDPSNNIVIFAYATGGSVITEIIAEAKLRTITRTVIAFQSVEFV